MTNIFVGMTQESFHSVGRMSSISFRRVLVPLDLVCAERGAPDAMAAGRGFVALPVAARESIETSADLANGGKVCLVHATPASTESMFFGVPEIGGPIVFPATTELDEEVRAVAQHTLEDVAERVIANRADYEVHVGSGPAADVILAQAEAFHADLIVLPTSGRRHGAVQAFGNTADQVIRKANCPVLMIPTRSRHCSDRAVNVAAVATAPENDERDYYDFMTSW